MPAPNESSSTPAPNTVVLVDEAGRELGTADKVECHRGRGRLHRALTCLLFDDQRRLLFARRAAAKPLWPGYWDATVATHQAPGEPDIEATCRRVRQELAADARDVIRPTQILYHAQYNEDWAERELCAVLLARVAEPLTPAPDEIDDLTWIALDDLSAFTASEPIAPWFLLAWQALQRDHADELKSWLG
ncbi:MAG TPA: isopentenyl-diphosphate Delta-isomerase [Phycisphaerae bacterium]|nr:isopentenyl-diphosphate Delta-isomerase [Phycisphaerae bacterium]